MHIISETNLSKTISWNMEKLLISTLDPFIFTLKLRRLSFDWIFPKEIIIGARCFKVL